jgi:hypothetical protein
VSQSSPITPLASGTMNTSGDKLSIELVEAPDLPPAIVLRWPAKPSATTPDGYANVAAACMRVLAAAVTELAAIRVWKRL